MIVQAWFSEDKLPALTDEQKEALRPLVHNQFLEIGNEVDGRRLVRGCLPVGNIAAVAALLAHKNPVICDVRDKDGVRYGWKKEFYTDSLFNIVPALDENGVQIHYPMNDAEHDIYMQDLIIDGITVKAVDNSTAGYAGWADRL